MEVEDYNVKQSGSPQIPESVDFTSYLGSTGTIACNVPSPDNPICLLYIHFSRPLGPLHKYTCRR